MSAKKKILVVEDDAVIQKLFTDTLRSAGYEVLAAPGSAEAVRLAQKEKPDLITLDIQLAASPEDSMDGFNVAGWLRRISGDKTSPKIIVISGTGTPNQLIEKAAGLGIYTCLVKPVEKQQLLETVAAALEAS